MNITLFGGRVPTLEDEHVVTTLAPVTNTLYTANAGTDLTDPVSRVGSYEEFERYAVADILKSLLKKKKKHSLDFAKQDLYTPAVSGAIGGLKAGTAALVAGVPIMGPLAGGAGLAAGVAATTGRARDTVDDALYDMRKKDLSEATEAQVPPLLLERWKKSRKARQAVKESLQSHKLPGAGLEVGFSYGGLLGAALGGATRFAGGETAYGGLARGGVIGAATGAALGGLAGLVYRIVKERQMRKRLREVYEGQ